tara:strand:- start:4444 stop:4731 length:288 start_codon:yes stop_codon:yes gene_type:complete
MVNSFMDDVMAEDSTDLLNNDMAEGEVREVQAGLNLVSAIMQKKDDSNIELKVDGVFGPKTYSAFKNFYTSLPEGTRNKLSAADNPLLNVDGKIV